MLDTLAAALHASDMARGLRASIWVYPLVNVGHIVGIALLFGGIVPLDWRLLGLWRGAPLAALARVLVPAAIAGLVLAVATGALLFATQPLDYIGEPLFGLKMALLLVAVANALALRLSPAWRFVTLAADWGDGPPRPGWRLAAVLSIALWLAVITAGRMIGYR